jgi:small GTP-binding protein
LIIIIDLILSIWDLGGQERFDFLKSQYFRGTAAIALCFDLSQPESFQKLDFYLSETRHNTGAGNIPILLVGTKSDLEWDLGEIVSSEQINNWMRTNQITDFIKTSAKTGNNIDQLFEKLSVMALIDLKNPPRAGEIRSDCIFRFKIVLVGAGGVGKTSIVHRFTEGVFASDYKLTVGVDFLTNKIQLNEDLLSEEVLDKIKCLKEKTILEAQKGSMEFKSEEGGLQKEQMARDAQQLFDKMDKLKAKYADEKTDGILADLAKSEATGEEEVSEFNDFVLSEEKQASIESAKDILKSVAAGEIADKTKDYEPSVQGGPQKLIGPSAGGSASSSIPTRPGGAPLKPMSPPAGSASGPQVPSFRANIQDESTELFKKRKMAFEEDEAEEGEIVEKKVEIHSRISDDRPHIPPGPPRRVPSSVKDGFVSDSDESSVSSGPSDNEMSKIQFSESKSLRQPTIPIINAPSDQNLYTSSPPPSIETHEKEHSRDLDKKGKKEESKRREKKEEKPPRERDEKLSKEATLDFAGMPEAGETITVEKILERKTTVFYRKQMNPMTHNKLSVILSSVKIYEQLKKKITEAQRAASDKTLQIKEASPIVEIQPVFPGCIVVPALLPLDARKDSDTADFDITPIAVGSIKKACIRLYYEGQLIDTIPTPTKVVKQTAAKFGGIMGVILPVFGPLFDERVSLLLPQLASLWGMIGGTENFFLLLSGITYVISSIFYIIKKPKEAEPIIAQFPSLDELLKKQMTQKKEIK